MSALAFFVARRANFWQLPILEYIYFGFPDNRIFNVGLISMIPEL
jgi:hypothetical protein